MKKSLLSFLALMMLCSVSWANCAKDNESLSKEESCIQEKQKCDKCTIEDDEYSIYNQCYFDKRYRKMKVALCLSPQQENCIDNIYKNFKSDLEGVSARYRVEKNKLLEMIACDDECYKKQLSTIKHIKKETKGKFSDFRDEIKEQLCKDQYRCYRKIARQEKKRMKKLIKYGAIYKLPCTECCN